KVGAEKEQLLTMVKDIVSKLQGVGQIEVKINGATGAKEAISQMGDLKKGQDALAISVKEYETLVNNLAKAQAKLNALESDAGKELLATKAAQAARNKEIKDEITLNQAAEGSLTQKRVLLKQLQKQYDDLAASARNASQGQ